LDNDFACLYIAVKYPEFSKAQTGTSPEKIREFIYLKTPKKK